VKSLLGTKLDENQGEGRAINFDVKAQMEEQQRRSGHISVAFELNVGTKPSAVKYSVQGAAIIEGKDEEIRKMLEVNPETQIPFVFTKVYQHVFMSVYLLATLIDAPYPPPNLLSSSEQSAEQPAAQMVAGYESRKREDSPQPVPTPASQEGAPPQPANVSAEKSSGL
jgi:hypothetical protein